jgi:hypothetical protein
MNWIYLSIAHSIIVAMMILYIKYNNIPLIVFPIIINIIVSIISIIYFILYLKEDFAMEFAKPKYYLYSFVVLFVNILGHYIIKVCPNPAYFRIFVSLQIIILLLATIYITQDYNISTQTMLGIFCGCAAIILISSDDNNLKDNNKSSIRL